MLLVLFACSCGGQSIRTTGRIESDPGWIGEYHGRIVYALANIPDRRQGTGLPVSLTIAPDGPDIRVEIVTAGSGPRWMFFLLPRIFTGTEVEFSRTGVPGDDNRRYTVSLRRIGKQVTGRLRVDELLKDNHETVSGYFLEVTRRENGPQ